MIAEADMPAPEPMNCSSAEVSRGQPAQVQQQQQLRDLGQLPHPGGQDHRGEPLALTSHGVDQLVVDPRPLDRDAARSRGHLPRLVEAVMDHQPTTALIELVGERLT